MNGVGLKRGLKRESFLVAFNELHLQLLLRKHTKCNFTPENTFFYSASGQLIKFLILEGRSGASAFVNDARTMQDTFSAV